MKKLEIAIAGNPNSGKTTLFNALTGARQQVGNWPGVTVERVEGSFEHDGAQIHATDLPGIYSFSAFSIDEKLAREHILHTRPDVVVNIVDATNVERNLFLTTQLLEMHVPVVVALSMMDVAHKRRIRIEVDHLARHLGCPVIPVVVPKKEGIEELRNAIGERAQRGEISPTRVQYDSELEKAVARIEAQVGPQARERKVHTRWLALKLLEHDEIADDLLSDSALKELVEAESKRVEAHTGEDIDIVIADGRYGFIHGLARDVVHRENEMRRTVSHAIDRVLLNRVVGIPIFFGIMYLVFMITMNVGAPFIDFFDELCGTIFVDGFGALLGALHCPDWLTALLADGVGGGIQTVATFIPPISLIFLCLAFLEDSGYMARAAFVMDRFLRTIGLPGKAFIPMLVGFGCNVPAILATRTLENSRDRILTIMMNPFMSCGARLPVYALFAAVFFPRSGGTVIFSLYIVGIVLAILTGLLFKQTILQGEATSFVMELPPYHFPTVRGILFHTWTRLKGFIIRAGQVVIIAVIILSFLNTIGTDGSIGHADSEDSVLSAVSRKVAPVFYPMGLTQENWPGAVGMFAGLFAKEAVVGTLDALYTQIGAEEDATGEEEPFDFWGGIIGAFQAIPAGFEGFGETVTDPLGMGVGDDLDDAGLAAEELEINQRTISTMARFFDGKVGAFAYLLFILIYTPCVAAVGAIFKETSFKWAAFAVFYLTLLAWVISTLFYQIGRFTRHPASSAAWIAIGVGTLLTLYAGLRIAARRQEATS
ncbi:MAG: Fe(2+) transporter permease subunit FeoB [Kiritimatiellia bacterium]|jgi:ferrous iron transport protein B|nr:Fe(2+) transporter permease subunit FeoB [Kiritimatiellia bacterium]MDP6631157.1 Fe(2+) transporter permease subunit FeoB [Kiritimatiellia bacterium]MDP6809821.1 Fe(2+) transporter permease subunit FeoB [Kiritimatiellia bacterium]MDP7025069.1 Fe(2+) transporter permease subunit FeoB [Kiritimatiellia bacterium]